MAELTYYSTPAEVKAYTGVKPEDLGLAKGDDAGLIALLTTWLEQIKNLIDTDRNRNYAAEGTVPKGIDNIALRMAANQVSNAMIMRDSPIIRVDEFSIRQVDKDKIMTDAIKADLANYLAKPSFRFMRVNTSSEDEDEEE